MLRPGPVLIANAPLQWNEELARLARAGDPLLAADGGANHLTLLGLRPVAVIGDLDSILPSTRAWVGASRLVERPDQDRTDLDKALAYAFGELGLERLVVLGALGGRVDQTVANLGLLARAARGAGLVFVERKAIVLAVEGGLELESTTGERWSFWTFDPRVEVSVEGVRWPLERADLAADVAPSISNRALGERVRVVARGGPVVVMRGRGEE